MRKWIVVIPLILLVSACKITELRSGLFSGQAASGASSDQSAEESEKEAEDIRLPVIIAPTSEQDEVLQIMRYSRIMNSYPKAKLKQEFKRVATLLQDDANPVDQVQMAILLSIPDTPFKNHNRAIQLLTKIVNDVSLPSSALQEYAYLLLETYQDRGVAQQLRSELTEELHQERRKRVMLQQQLNALKSIEKSINQRQQQEEAPTQ